MTQPDVLASTPVSPPTPTIITVLTPGPPLPSSSVASIFAETVPESTTTALNPNTPININLTTSNTSDVNSVHTCLHYDRTFTPHIGLVGHFRTHLTEAGESVPGAPTHSRRIRPNCPHCPRAFTHCMVLLGHVCNHESGIDRSLDTPSTPCTSTIPSSTHTPSRGASTDSSSTTTTITETDADIAYSSCPHCPRIFTSHIGLVGHLRIHRTETSEPAPGAPICTHRIRLHCPHCSRTFTRCTGLLNHMQIHENLW
nr:unnamed protein product [Spirometra erinaceieuropaei]